MSHLIAHGTLELSAGPEPSEQTRGSVFLTDDGGLEIIAEHPDDATLDTRITFTPNAVEDAVRKRIRGKR